MMSKIGRPSWCITAVGLCVVAAAVLRVAAARGDLWLDEIWSLRTALQVASFGEIITGVHHDNNHILTTMFLRLVGDTPIFLGYRLLSIVSGTALVALTALAAVRRDSVEMVTAAVLASASFPLVLYGSEARGYAPAMCFAMLSWVAIQAHWRGHRWGWLGFQVAVVLGFLSHLTFAFVYLSILLWSVARALRSGDGWRQSALDLGRSHVAMLLFVSFLYFVDVRHLVVSGGPIYSFWAVLRRTVAMATGAPETGGFALVAFLAVGLATVFAIVRLAKDGSERWLFFLGAVCLMPALVLTVNRPTFLYFRYFVVCFPFFYLLAANALAACFRQGRLGKVLYALVLGLFLSGQVGRVAPLIEHGRGDYKQALMFMAAEDEASDLVIGSDNDVWARTLLRFYGRDLPSSRRVVYVNRGGWPPGGPEWLIRQPSELDHQPAPWLVVPTTSARYILAGSYRYGGTSGWHWFVYRRQGS